MDFKKLATFRSAAHTLNFSETAGQLGYVQSAVTNQIKALEEELSVSLFERNGRGVTLTPAGTKLLDYSQRLFELREEAKSALIDSNCQHQLPPIRIGGYETILTYYLPILLRSFSHKQPKAQFHIQALPVASLKNEIASEKLDVAFILEKRFARAGLTIHTYAREPVVIVCATNHELAQRTDLTITDLGNQHLLLTEQGCCYRNQFERALIDVGAFTGQVSEFASIETIKQCALMGMGIAALSYASVADELKQGKLQQLNIQALEIDTELQMAVNNQRHYPEHVQEFISFCSRFDFSRLNSLTE